MSLDKKITPILNIENTDACTVSQIKDGWVIDALPIKSEELPILFNKLFLETPSEKKRLSLLTIILKVGPDFIPFLPSLTHITSTTWYSEPKFIQSYLKTIAKISAGLQNYIESLIDYRHLADLGLLLENVHNAYKNYLLKAFFLSWKRLKNELSLNLKTFAFRTCLLSNCLTKSNTFFSFTLTFYLSFYPFVPNSHLKSFR